ncbi:MAG: bacteriohemerythrin [Magnetococcus sp. DMHC-8]
MANDWKIKKITVAKGIFWIEIAEADLRILCGCPMDSVKHLVKRGLICQTEKAGISCETGPNAVLLSDVVLQNGEFCNLGEFPVLQMLYKQGLILPNHPNNTGQKPLLIGLAEQVNAQLQYIYRGNYGLVSREEMMEAGLDAETARKMMRLKLRFAFGAIRLSQDFLDACLVGDGVVAIRNGVFIRRLATNVFEFAYAGEKAVVDLNLETGEQYESAYPLGFQCLSREYFSIVHAGEGDGWDVNRPSMSSVLMFQGKIYLIDAGPNLFYNLSALGVDIDELEGIFHTHAHDDHFAGITTLMRAGHKLKYFATSLVRATVTKKIAALLSVEEDLFGEFFDVRDLQAGVWNDVDGLDVKPVNSPHPVENTVFLFRTLWDDGYKTYAHFADLVGLELLEGMIETDNSKPGISRGYFERIKAEYLTPVNLKKLDVGGGMIHGMAKDFKTDRSERILLSHISRELTLAEKEIGSSAPYGMVDVLIVGQSDFARRSAFAFLQSALPTLPMHHLRIMINNPVIDCNPGVILLKEGAIPQYIHLVLTGAVERIRTSDNLFNRLSIGALVGESAGLYNLPSRSTYRTACFVRALRIPVALYRELIQRNELMARIERTWEDRDFLESTHLFNEGVPYHVLSRIVEAIQTEHFESGAVIPMTRSHLNIIRAGRVERLVGDQRFDLLGERDCFGEEWAVFHTPSLFRPVALEPVTTCQIPASLLRDIPIVRWKLREAYLMRTGQVLHATTGVAAFRWEADLSVQLLPMDIQHKKLLEIASVVVERLRFRQEREALTDALDALVDHVEHHFLAEERLMARYGYAGLAGHQEKHRALYEQLQMYRQDLPRRDDIHQDDFKQFFTGWLTGHIRHEDGGYGAFLNTRGVY